MKIFTVKNEKMRLNINPIPKLNEKVIFSVWNISIDFNIIAANITGIDKNKENFDDCTLSYPKNLEVVITIPDLLTPGIIAIPCIKPIIIESFSFGKNFLLIFISLNLLNSFKLWDGQPWSLEFY